MNCLINGTGIEEGLYPLTCERPAGLLSAGKSGQTGEKTILDSWIDEMEEKEQIGVYLVVSCEKYASAYETWRQEHVLKEKIRLELSEENTDSPALIRRFIQNQEDWLVLPHNAAFSIQYIVEAWREQAEQESCCIYCGNEVYNYVLPIYVLKEGQYAETMKKLFLYRPEKLIKSMPEYERMIAEAGSPKRYREFSIQAYTQERYGKYYISGIRMETTIHIGGRTLAYIRVHNGGDACLGPERVRIGYRTWLEQTYEDSFQVDKIPMPQKDPVPIPIEIKAGESQEFPIYVDAPEIYGKYYLQFDMEIDGVWQAEAGEYFCFPYVSFVCEAVGVYSGAALHEMKKVYLTGLPGSANAGEQLEAEAAKVFIKRVLPEYYLVEYMDNELENFWIGGDRFLNERDRIVPYASGRLAMAAIGEEQLRRRTAPIATNPEFLVPFVVPPQHMMFPDTEEGREQIGHSAGAYKGSNYFMLGGNEKDFCFLREHFRQCNIGKAPRLSFSMDAPELEVTENDFTVVVCGGSREGFLDNTFRIIDDNGYRRMYLNLDYNAYQPGAWFGPESRKYLIDFCYKTIGVTKTVVTDSVYGLSFALMCHRSCVVLGCSEEKEWFQDRSDIFFIEELEELEAACLAAVKEKGQGPLSMEVYADMERFLKR